MSSRIQEILAQEILDSRGNPTVSARVILEDGSMGEAAVPSGASTGIHEALELRDGDKKRYRGLGVLKAVKNINGPIRDMLLGEDAREQQMIDEDLCKLDGTANKGKLGANAILAVSLSVAKAAAAHEKLPLYEYLREAFQVPVRGWKLPMPMVNILNGGRHADTDLDMQEFMIVPVGAKTMKERLRYAAEVFHALGGVLKAKKLSTGVGNEGGYAPMVGKTTNAFAYLLEAIKKAGFKAGKDICFALDAAASEFYDAKKRRYELKTDKASYTADKMIALWQSWIKKYPLISVEDGLAEDDWAHWEKLTAKIGDKVMLVGDDFFVTNTERLIRGIETGCANAILIKPNQIGSLTETMEAIMVAQEHGYKVIISHRSGETVDTIIADIAVAVNAEFIKTGSMSRGERIAKYNRLLEIEAELKAR